VGIDGTVEAAGGVVTRSGPHGTEVLAVHRPKYDDWSLPKGKLEQGETHEAAACREVEEETAWECELRGELPAVRYQDRRGRPKHVRYWRMTARSRGTFTPNEEVDEVRWLSLPEAATLLSYEADRRLLRELASSDPDPHRPERHDPEEQGAGEHR
jgi:8-oxo-dGTP pyrophosphatase MutT (NUDIX family)